MLILVSSGSSKRKITVCRGTGGPHPGGERIYVATMQVWDAESRKRVERHRVMQPEKGFRTVEQPVRLGDAGPRRAVVLLEDLSNLAANEWFDGGDRRESLRGCTAGIRKLRDRSSTAVVATMSFFRRSLL